MTTDSLLFAPDDLPAGHVTPLQVTHLAMPAVAFMKPRDNALVPDVRFDLHDL